MMSPDEVKKFIKEILLPFHRHTGPALSPFNAWIVLKALETPVLQSIPPDHIDPPAWPNLPAGLFPLLAGAVF